MLSADSAEMYRCLAKASKKFLKSCDQIKVINNKISELYEAYSQCDDDETFSADTTTTSTESTSSSVINPLTSFYTKHDREHMHTLNRSFKAQLMKDFLLQQIENLKSLKQIYLIYARRKATEITHMQNELYDGTDEISVGGHLSHDSAETTLAGSTGEAAAPDRNGIENNQDENEGDPMASLDNSNIESEGQELLMQSNSGGAEAEADEATTSTAANPHPNMFRPYPSHLIDNPVF